MKRTQLSIFFTVVMLSLGRMRRLVASTGAMASEKEEKYVMLHCDLCKGDIVRGNIVHKRYTDAWLVPARYTIKEVLSFVIDQMWQEGEVIFDVKLICQQVNGVVKQMFAHEKCTEKSVSVQFVDKRKLLKRLATKRYFDLSFDNYFNQPMPIRSWKEPTDGKGFLVSREALQEYLILGASYLTKKEALKDIKKRMTCAMVWSLLVDNIEGKAAICQAQKESFTQTTLQEIGIDGPTLEMSIQNIGKDFIPKEETIEEITEREEREEIEKVEDIEEPPPQNFLNTTSSVASFLGGTAVTYVTLKLSYLSPKEKKKIHRPK
ncbi:MAG: hypothetical protein AAF335_04790 [Bacteroidota bacterium]